jgi:hypothetical protein
MLVHPHPLPPHPPQEARCLTHTRCAPALQGCLQLLQLPPAQLAGQLEACNMLTGLLLYVLLLIVTVAGGEQQQVVLHMAQSGLLAAAVEWIVAAGARPRVLACCGAWCRLPWQVPAAAALGCRGHMPICVMAAAVPSASGQPITV